MHAFSLESGRGALLRTQFLNKLNTRSAYSLLAADQVSRYASLFELVWSQQRRRYGYEYLSDWIAAVDARGDFAGSFALNVATYNKLISKKDGAEYSLLNSRDAEFLLTAALRNFAAEIDIEASTALSVPLIGKVLPYATSEVKRQWGLDLMRLYEEDASLRVCVGFLIKSFGLDLDLEAHTEFMDLYAELPDIPEVGFPGEEWRDRGQLLALQRFYPDENWFDYTVELYEKRGWKLDEDYLSQQGLDPARYRVLKKQVEGIELVMVFELAASTRSSLGSQSQEGSVSLPGLSIKVHRGHNAHLEKTFSPGERGVDINVSGGCQNLRDILFSPELKARGFWIADANTGEGEVTSLLVEELMVGMVRGEQNWEFLSHYKKHGIVLPDSPVFQIDRYGALLFDETKK